MLELNLGLPIIRAAFFWLFLAATQSRRFFPGLVAPRWGRLAALCDLSTPSTGDAAAGVRVRRLHHTIGGFGVIFLLFFAVAFGLFVLPLVICHQSGPRAASSALSVSQRLSHSRGHFKLGSTVHQRVSPWTSHEAVQGLRQFRLMVQTQTDADRNSRNY